MNFQTLQKIEKAQTYIDNALRQSTKRADELRAAKKAKDRTAKSRTIELARVETFENSLTSKFNNIVKSYPDFDTLPEFYKELSRACLDVDKLRKSLGAVNWARRQIQAIGMETKRKIKINKQASAFNTIRKSFIGRACSIVKQVKNNLTYLEEARRIMKRFPTLKTSWYTVVIAGAPNVGKSTLLAALTGSKPEIAYYPFTTKNLNFGSDKKNKIQYVDTPGLLDRPLSKRNKIEQQAIIALKHIANMIIFIYDPTPVCGYTLEAQKNLLQEIKQKFKTPIIEVVNKADLETSELARPISAKEGTGIEELKALILSAKDNWTASKQTQEENTQPQQ